MFGPLEGPSTKFGAIWGIGIALALIVFSLLPGPFYPGKRADPDAKPIPAWFVRALFIPVSVYLIWICVQQLRHL